ncbi:general odorant-binding protein 69a [Diachasma alloeum]|uniref:Odorant binding protein 13 n=1 Tax=Diachasma alloeum TaxID=454923 RepID=A0A4E0S4I3_9HYME|nr:general odorant-binding protein 69a [Diachasma alloeum]THK33083.1 odorant binding protein 13 [Diachasma alloeum]
MKSGILLGLAILLVAQSFENAEAKMTIPQVTNMLMPMRKTCIQKTGASADLVDAPKTGPMPDDPSLKCYYSCLLKMVKVVTKEGLPNYENMVKQMDMMLPADDLTARLKDVINLCAPKVTSTEPCEANWQFIKCFYETDKNVCFFP